MSDACIDHDPIFTLFSWSDVCYLSGSWHIINYSTDRMRAVDFLRDVPVITSKIYQHYRYIRPYTRESRHKNALGSGTNISIFSSPRGGSTWIGELLDRKSVV